MQQEKKKVHAAFTPLSRKFLAFNNPDNTTAYLRKPQFEALEMYVFLKEFFLPSDDIFAHLDKRKPFHWEMPLLDGITFFQNPDNKEVPFSKYPADFIGVVTKPVLESNKINRYIKELDYVADLNLPSVQHENPREDFAESFRIWVLTPGKFKARQKERLLKTLWLSGFYGKKIVMRKRLY
mgnify:CR=1 FL=1